IGDLARKETPKCDRLFGGDDMQVSQQSNWECWLSSCLMEQKILTTCDETDQHLLLQQRLQVHFKRRARVWQVRSEEHTSELQSLMRISYAVFCLTKNTK